MRRDKEGRRRVTIVQTLPGAPEGQRPYLYGIKSHAVRDEDCCEYSSRS